VLFGCEKSVLKPDQVLKRKAAQLVRMALFFEYRRNPIKRGDVMKLGKSLDFPCSFNLTLGQVLPSQARAFNAVLERTQKILRNTFGMELVELRGKRKGAAEPVANGATQAGPSQMKGKRRAIRNGAGSEEEEEEEGEEEEPAAGKKRARCTSSSTIADSKLNESEF
jgi:hypothetical protein